MPRPFTACEYWIEETDVGRFVVYIPSSPVLLQEDAAYAKLYEDLANYAVRSYSRLIANKAAQITKKIFIVRPPLARYDFLKSDGTPVFDNDNFKISLSTTGEWQTIFEVAYNLEKATVDGQPTDFTFKGLFIKGFTIPQPDPPVRLVRFQKGDEKGPVIDLVAFRNERGDVVIPGPPVIVFDNVVKLLGNVNATGDFIIDMAKLSVVVEPIEFAPLYVRLVAQEVIV